MVLVTICCVVDCHVLKHHPSRSERSGVSRIGGNVMNKYILALDQGTTSSRCIIYNKNGQRGTEGISPVLSAAGLGRARRRRNLVYPDDSGPRSHAQGGCDVSEYRGHRHHQSEGNDGGLGQAYRAAGTSRHCMAVQTYRGILRPAHGAGAGSTI